MNTNITLTCEVCEQDTDCRIGYSNRTIQPLSFACPHCGSLLKITLDISHAPKSNFRYKSCHPSENQPTKPFDGTNPFVLCGWNSPIVQSGKHIKKENLCSNSDQPANIATSRCRPRQLKRAFALMNVLSAPHA